MHVTTWINLPIDCFCRIEHVQAEVTASQHLQGARAQVGSPFPALFRKERFCPMGIVECLTIVILSPSDVCKTGERLTHQVRHLVFLSDIVSTTDEIECFVVRTLGGVSQLCGIGACVVE